MSTSDTPAVVPVGQSPAVIPLPAGLRAVLALNASGGIGDAAGAPDIIVNTGQMASLNPQMGVRLRPGELFNMPLLDPGTGYQLELSAVATGPGATLQLLLRE